MSLFNSDGTMRAINTRRANSGGQSSFSHFGWEDATKENSAAAANSPKASNSPKAAGMRSKIFGDRESPLKLSHRPGSDARQRANQGSLVFGEAAPSGRPPAGARPESHDEQRGRGVSDAKKRALYESRIFNATEEPVAASANELSKLKLREVKGHDIFNSNAEPERSHIGGVRKPPGGGSSLSMKDLHGAADDEEADKVSDKASDKASEVLSEEPLGEAAAQDEPAPAPVKGVRRDVGGQSSFSFGW